MIAQNWLDASIYCIMKIWVIMEIVKATLSYYKMITIKVDVILRILFYSNVSVKWQISIQLLPFKCSYSCISFLNALFCIKHTNQLQILDII